MKGDGVDPGNYRSTMHVHCIIEGASVDDISVFCNVVNIRLVQCLNN